MLVDNLDESHVAGPVPAAVRLLDEDEIVLAGRPYLEVLGQLHALLRPRTYLEIGTWRGASLRLARCKSLAIDPDFQLEEGVIGDKPVCILHQSTSDAFFADRDPAQILDGPVDLAFIDALHVFEYVLRDFIGTERSCRPGSYIVLDDCCPRDLFMSRRTLVSMADVPTKYPGYWTGDVWKLIPVLRSYRPDVQLTCVDATPTGLVVCTNLDPKNRTLEDNYEQIVAAWRDIGLERYGLRRLLEDLRVESSESLATLDPIYPGDPAPPPTQAHPSQSEIITELTHQLDAIRSSTSWRITRPLRIVGEAARAPMRRWME